MRLTQQVLPGREELVVYICEQQIDQVTHVGQSTDRYEAIRQCLEMTKRVQKNHLQSVKSNDDSIFRAQRS